MGGPGGDYEGEGEEEGDGRRVVEPEYRAVDRHLQRRLDNVHTRKKIRGQGNNDPFLDPSLLTCWAFVSPLSPLNMSSIVRHELHLAKTSPWLHLTQASPHPGFTPGVTRYHLDILKFLMMEKWYQEPTSHPRFSSNVCSLNCRVFLLAH